MSFTWTLRPGGWADCHVEDSRGHATARVSYITPAPEEFLSAVTRLVLGATEQRVQFKAEPQGFRWIFTRDHKEVDICLLELPYDTDPDASGTVIWASRQPIDTLARTVIRAFDHVEFDHSEDGYLEHWRSPFPRHELEALRTAWHSTQQARDTTPE
jgi:hypothetical protein